jgi:hypothetical protein
LVKCGSDVYIIFPAVRWQELHCFQYKCALTASCVLYDAYSTTDVILLWMLGWLNKKTVNHAVVTYYMSRSQNCLAVAGEKTWSQECCAGHLAATYGFRISNVTDNRYDIWDRMQT